MKMRMDTTRLLDLGARGVHLLFANDEIEAAFEQDATALRAQLAGRAAEVSSAIDALMHLDDLGRGRALIDSLDPHVRHILVLIYFDLLDTHVRPEATRH
jgi:hypothetical protein